MLLVNSDINVTGWTRICGTAQWWMAKKSTTIKKITPRPKVTRRPLFLKEWRKYRSDMTQERLADAAGITQGMVSQLENNKSDYTGELLERLAYVLRCEPADLIMRNPLIPNATWTLIDTVKAIPEDRHGQALRILKALTDEEAA